MAFKSLLPPNALPQQRDREATLARIENIPVPIRDLWKPDHCPDELLPLLAWTLSVDHWDPEWPEATKRAVIKNSYKVHAHKGTRLAIDTALEPLDITVHLTEWFEQDPPGPHGTFIVELKAEENRSANNPPSARTISNALAMMRGAKRLSQHLEFKMTALLASTAGVGGGLGLGAAASAGGTTRMPLHVVNGGLAGQLTFGASSSIGT